MKVRRSYSSPLGLKVLSGLALVLAGCAMAPGVPPAAPRAAAPDLVALHDARSPSFDRNCLNCHGDIMARTTLSPRFKEAHAAMVPFTPGYDARVGVTNETCAACHGKVDMVQHSGGQIRKNASMASCGLCHSKSGPASKKFYAN